LGLKTGFLIEILSAAELPVADKGTGSSDPYISCHVKGKKAKTHFKTHHVEKNLNPIWTENNVWGPFNAYEQEFLIIKVWDHDALKDDCIGKIKIKSIEVGIGNISIPFGMVKEGVAFGGTLNLKVTKGHDLKPPKKVKAPKVGGEINIDIEGKGKGKGGIEIDAKIKEPKIKGEVKVKEPKVGGDVEVDIEGKGKGGIHFPKIGGKKKGSKSKSSSSSSKDSKQKEKRRYWN